MTRKLEIMTTIDGPDSDDSCEGCEHYDGERLCDGSPFADGHQYAYAADAPPACIAARRTAAGLRATATAIGELQAILGIEHDRVTPADVVDVVRELQRRAEAADERIAKARAVLVYRECDCECQCEGVRHQDDCDRCVACCAAEALRS